MRAAAVLVLACAVLAGACSPAVRGSMALTRGDHAQALALYHEALSAEPDSAYLRKRIGLVYFDMPDYPRAEAAFLDALTRAPGDPEAVLYLGLSRIGKGEREAGLDMLEGLKWPFKFYHQKYVREEARRLRNHPDQPAGEIIRSVLKALEDGKEEQRRMEYEVRNFPNG